MVGESEVKKNDKVKGSTIGLAVLIALCLVAAGAIVALSLTGYFTLDKVIDGGGAITGKIDTQTDKPPAIGNGTSSYIDSLRSSGKDVKVIATSGEQTIVNTTKVEVVERSSSPNQPGVLYNSSVLSVRSEGGNTQTIKNIKLNITEIRKTKSMS